MILLTCSPVLDIPHAVFVHDSWGGLRPPPDGRTATHMLDWQVVRKYEALCGDAWQVPRLILDRTGPTPNPVMDAIAAHAARQPSAPKVIHIARYAYTEEHVRVHLPASGQSAIAEPRHCGVGLSGIWHALEHLNNVEEHGDIVVFTEGWSARLMSIPVLIYFQPPQ